MTVRWHCGRPGTLRARFPLDTFREAGFALLHRALPDPQTKPGTTVRLVVSGEFRQEGGAGEFEPFCVDDLVVVEAQDEKADVVVLFDADELAIRKT